MVTLVNLADRVRAVAVWTGTDQGVLGFPGVSGTHTRDGVAYHEVDRQPATIGVADGWEEPSPTPPLQDSRGSDLF